MTARSCRGSRWIRRTKTAVALECKVEEGGESGRGRVQWEVLELVGDGNEGRRGSGRVECDGFGPGRLCEKQLVVVVRQTVELLQLLGDCRAVAAHVAGPTPSSLGVAVVLVVVDVESEDSVVRGRRG